GQCVQRSYGEDSFVCVCDAEFCDEPGVALQPAAGTYVVYTSTRADLRLQPSSGPIQDSQGNASTVITVNTTAQFQTILGFGSSYTDAAGLNLNSLSDAAKENAIRSYFAPEGNEYNMVRVPIGGADFSERPYSLDDINGDVDLFYWSLSLEDYDYKIPNIKRSMELSDEEIYVMGTPWSPPAWMKSTGVATGVGLGYLYPELWQPYAEYVAKWPAAYEAEGVPIWGLSPQNEPLTNETNWTINACQWLPEDMRDWIKDHLGPTLADAGYGHLQLLAYDFNRSKMPYYAIPLLEDPDCNKYISGIAYHWYEDDLISPDVVLQVRDLDPTKFILHTEACTGVRADESHKVLLGDWSRGEYYVEDILQNLNYYSSGWIDWNLALDTRGGPAWPGGGNDSPMIINATADEFYKQPMHYALAHFGKFFKRGSVRVETSVSGSVDAASVLRPDGSLAIVILSRNDAPESVSMSIDGTRFLNAELPARSFSSFVI
ncbi:Glycosyl hydrolase family 30 TIM-barrel domain, partial [Trinorchestia longiramus]